MAEYIEREAALGVLCEYCPCDPGCNKDKCYEHSRIREMPAADVVEVRHGKWYKGDMPTYGGYKCSFCELNTVEYNKPYCPNCGAKMDGKGE